MANKDFSLTVFTGNLGKDPTMRFTGAGKAVTSFSVAVNDSYTGTDGQAVSKTAWYTVTAWGKLAEICNQYLKKGRRVLISGRIEPQRSYDKSDGSGKGYSGLEITAAEVHFLGAPTADGGQEGPVDQHDEAPVGETINFN